MLVVGLTGGIGSGKSTVADMFLGYGVSVIDADVIARTVLEAQPELLRAIIHHFGSEIINSEGKLVRSRLARRIFVNRTERRWLEDLLHPVIIQEIRRQIAEQASLLNSPPYCIVVIPLLAEMRDPDTLVDRILVVDTPIEIQLRRLQQRDHVTLEEAKTILETQATREERMMIANDTIHNDQDLSYLKSAVEQLHQIYCNRSGTP